MSPDSIKATYRRMMNERGETVVHRRFTGAGPNRPRFDADVMGVEWGYEPRDYVGSIVQGESRFILLVEDLVEAQIALPVTTNDKLVVKGRELSITGVDTGTRGSSGETYAYVLRVKG